MFELVEIDVSNWRRALAVEVRADQVRFVADHQPVALVILSKCYVRPDGQTWTPYLARRRRAGRRRCHRVGGGRRAPPPLRDRPPATGRGTGTVAAGRGGRCDQAQSTDVQI